MKECKCCGCLMDDRHEGDVCECCLDDMDPGENVEEVRSD